MTGKAASVSGVTKKFGSTTALDGVDFDVDYGEIHAIVGENGAGKSTLIKILGGVHHPDRGEIRIDGWPRRFASPRDAIAAGIVTIPQELRLVPALSIAENIALGDLPVRRLIGFLPTVDRARMRDEARAVLAQLDYTPDVNLRVGRLSFAERQLVAIAKALHRRCRIFVLDEPTAALEKREIARLFAVLERMKALGTAIVYISHQLDEVVALADRCTIMRDGRVTAVARRGAFAVGDLIAAMTGQSPEDFSPAAAEPREVLLEGPRTNAGDAIRLRSGEILGLAGLLGSGTEPMLRALFGAADEPHVVTIKGRARRLADPAAAIRAGIGFVPGERALGLVMNQSVHDNILLPSLDLLTRAGCFDRTAGDRMVRDLMDLLDVRPRRPELKVSALSGGNQQKVILAKWLARRVAVLLLLEPTQGIDVGAKAQIHALVRDFIRRGGGALISSSDLGELTHLCDSVLAVRQGRIAARLDRGVGLDEPQLRAAIGG
ncbi:MAG: sugar ABC transporter ATP-binding protein [Xanthobacteraceae bacterium]